MIGYIAIGLGDAFDYSLGFRSHPFFFRGEGLSMTDTSKHMPMGWQTMETAPKDGTIILGWADYSPDFYITIPMRWFKYNNLEAWRTLDGELLSPTHWMPAPSPPGSEPAPNHIAQIAELREALEIATIALWVGGLNKEARKAERGLCKIDPTATLRIDNATLAATKGGE